MRVLVCGGRGYGVCAVNDPEWRRIAASAEREVLHTAMQILLDGIVDPIVVTGGAKGADYLADEWARANCTKEPEVFPANWARYGRGAGNVRNQEMLETMVPGRDMVIVFPGGSGTRDMMNKAAGAGLLIHEVEEDGVINSYNVTSKNMQ